MDTYAILINASLGTSNYLVNGRMYYQAYTVTNNIYNRGSIANNLYWNNTNNVWATSNSTNSDFGMVRFENGGLQVILYLPASQPGNGSAVFVALFPVQIAGMFYFLSLLIFNLYPFE